MPEVDLVVLGGGIHGAGVAQAASAAGYRVLVLEKTGVGSGTSCRSTKLIHGGLRYLETGQFQLVYQAIRERELLLKLAPDLIHRLPFFLPLYQDASRRASTIRMGLRVYDLFSRFTDAPLSTTVPKANWSQSAGLKLEQLQSLFTYSDAQTDDALLTRAVMQSAVGLGAVVACPAHFEAVQAQADGCRVRFSDAVGQQEVFCSAVVNAMGPWGVSMEDRFSPPIPGLSFDLVEGTHIECRDAQLNAGYYLESPSDHRGVFVLPWKQRTLVGTTESIYHGSPDQLQPQQASIDYLQGIFAHYFPDQDHTVMDAWSGLRVLPKQRGAPFGRSRETQVLRDGKQNPRVVHVLGGKLTTYRLTAKQVLRNLTAVLPQRTAVADTASLPLQRPT